MYIWMSLMVTLLAALTPVVMYMYVHVDIYTCTYVIILRPRLSDMLMRFIKCHIHIMYVVGY